MRDQRASTGADHPPPRATRAAEAVARRLPTARPWVAGATVVVVAYLTLTACMVGVGLLVASGGRGGWDDIGVNRWFVGERTATLDDFTALGSRMAETLTVIAIAVVVVAFLGLRRRFADAGLIAIGLLLEVSVFLTTTMLVDRSRPRVARLDAAPPTSSFPSGHTAAAVVLYGGVALILLRSIKARGLRMISAAVLCAIPVIVCVSRLYRGMHHPTDVVVGVLLGVACLAVAGLAVLVITYDEDRRARPAPSDERRVHSVGAFR